MNVIENFTGKADGYAKYRPTYPNSVYEYILNDCGLPKKPIFADVGAGTGKFSLPLIKAGHTVYCVEPNSDMKQLLDENTKDFRNCINVSATAENTTLADNSVDCITVAQAFHWFDRQAFKTECKRILKAEGKIFLVWNSRVEDELLTALGEINKKYCPKFKGFIGGIHKNDTSQFDDFFAEPCSLVCFDNDLYYESADAFVGRCLSSSSALTENDKAYDEYVRELKKLYAKFENRGRVNMRNRVEVYSGKV